jgi:hypothetical protein
MNWTNVTQGLADVLTVCLVLRLLALRLHNVYRVFCLFLLFDLFSSSVAFYEFFAHNARLDYRLTWIAMRVVAWVLTMWMIYTFLSAVLQSVPGILKISRRVMNYVFPIAIALSALSFLPEYVVSGAATMTDPIDHAVGVAIVLERVIATIALLVFASVLVFVLWFPVQMPRNLAVFTIGLVFYFSAEITLLLVRSYFSHHSFTLVGNGITLALCACYVYWGLLITASGETAPVRMGHSWRKVEQIRLIGRLDALNAALLSAGARHAGSHTRP